MNAWARRDDKLRSAPRPPNRFGKL